MSHRKVYSHGNIPFSWEDKPGISKLIFTTTKQGCPVNDHSSNYSNQESSQKNSDHVMVMQSSNNDHTIPLPPCPAASTSRPPSRGNSGKGLKWQLLQQVQDQQDPFLLAYKECTKPTKNSKSSQLLTDPHHHRNNHHHRHQNYKGKLMKGPNNNNANKNKSMFSMYFSCKSTNSCDVVNSRNVSPKLPPLPTSKLQDVVIDNW